MTSRSASAVAVVLVLALVACTDPNSDGGSVPTNATFQGTVQPEPVPKATAATPSTIVTSDEGSGSTSSVVAEPPVETSGIARGSIPDGAGQELGPLGSTELDVDTGEGTVQVGDADVPAMAETFPIPDGLDVQLSSETAADAGFSGVVEGSVSQFADFYVDALPVAGFEIVVEQRVSTGAEDADLSAVIFTFESDQLEGSVAIARAPGTGSASIIVAIAAL